MNTFSRIAIITLVIFAAAETSAIFDMNKKLTNVTNMTIDLAIKTYVMGCEEEASPRCNKDNTCLASMRDRCHKAADALKAELDKIDETVDLRD
jgi:hypothetical protein